MPFACTTVVMSEIVSRVLARTGPRPLMLAGGVLTAGGTWWFTMLTAHSTYLGSLLGPLVITAAGFGLLFVPMTLTGTSLVAPADAGVAASLLNTSQQVGGAIGLAALGSAVWTVVAGSIRSQTAQAVTAGHAHLAVPTAVMIDQALAAGFSRGFLIAFGVSVLALAAVAALVRQPCPVPADHPVPLGCPGTRSRRPRALASENG